MCPFTISTSKPAHISHMISLNRFLTSGVNTRLRYLAIHTIWYFTS
jgi:hypothetical protein